MEGMIGARHSSASATPFTDGWAALEALALGGAAALSADEEADNEVRALASRAVHTALALATGRAAIDFDFPD